MKKKYTLTMEADVQRNVIHQYTGVKFSGEPELADDDSSRFVDGVEPEHIHICAPDLRKLFDIDDDATDITICVKRKQPKGHKQWYMCEMHGTLYIEVHGIPAEGITMEGWMCLEDNPGELLHELFGDDTLFYLELWVHSKENT
jgi:hypothetical protein